MSRRAPLQKSRLESSVHAMTRAASAARGLWQRCVRELRARQTFLSVFSSGVDVGREASSAVSKATLQRLACVQVENGFGRVSEESISRISVSWRREVLRRASCTAVEKRGVWCPARLYSFAASGSLNFGARVSSWEGFSRLNAMKLSTVPASEQNASENVPVESVASVEAVVLEGEVSSELEFTPENGSIPSTPLVQAIQSQEESVSAELPSSPDEELEDLFGDKELPPGGTQALLENDSDRVVQPGRIYIGGLPFQMKGEELRNALRELCGKHGIVMDVNLAQHRNQSYKSIVAGKHRGFAFVTMETPEEAQEVIDNLNGASAFGRVLTVSYGLKRIEPDPSENLPKEKVSLRCKVFVGNLHEGTSRKDLLTKFQQYGTVVDVKLITELHSNRSRGFGFVTFAEETQAIKAVLDCDGSILDGSVIRVNIAKYPQSY
ncbi:unnamed protein product [Calypogeia fissa]